MNKALFISSIHVFCTFWLKTLCQASSEWWCYFMDSITPKILIIAKEKAMPDHTDTNKDPNMKPLSLVKMFFLSESYNTMSLVITT